MPLKTTADDPTAINLTPMIDVVFLLVIFFMVATKFTEAERSIDLQLPTAAAAGDSAPPPEPRTVSVFEDGHVELDGQTVGLAELTARLAELTAHSDDLQVVIHGDARTDFQHVAAALAACREGRVSDLGITVEIAAAGGALQ
ncbi:MAG: biopolymer transporter ExbD, partial [Planctomycetota bacterium]